MLLTTAYAGTADLQDDTLDVLNNSLPANLGMVYIPEELPKRRLPRKPSGLEQVIGWLESEVGKDGTIPVPDLLAALVTRRDGKDEGQDESDDVALVMLYDPENEDDVALAKAAHELDIRVINLRAAGDDLLFEEDTPPFDTGEAAAPEDAVAPEDVAMAAMAREQEAADARSAALAETMVVSDQGGVVLHLHLDAEGVRALARAIVAEMAGRAQVEIKAAGLPVPAMESPVAAADGSGPVGAEEHAPDTKAFYYNDAEGKYRPARGIARAGERKLYLTEAQIAEARAGNFLV